MNSLKQGILKIFKPILWRLDQIEVRNQLMQGYSRGAASAAVRIVDPKDPLSWEFCAFSQNSEDGIIDYLTRNISEPNKFFVEIGSGNGIENNTTWLALARKYNGIMIEGDKEKSYFAKNLSHNLGVSYYNLFVDKDNIKEIMHLLPFNNPDVFSLDIDGNDYYIALALLTHGFRPKIIAVEYNSAFGPNKKMTINYEREFNIISAHSSQLYYGVSIEGWRSLFQSYNYSFISVDSNGVNAFFIDTQVVDKTWIEKIKGCRFQENFYQRNKFKKSWEGQFDLIKSMPFHHID